MLRVGLGIPLVPSSRFLLEDVPNRRFVPLAWPADMVAKSSMVRISVVLMIFINLSLGMRSPPLTK
jgi:hypothetical protein